MLWAAITAMPARQSRFVYVGTYTAPNLAPGGSQPSRAEGIYVFEMDGRTGNLKQLQVVPASNPSFLALSPSHVYCVNEDDVSAISAYAIDPARGTLRFVNSVPSAGSAPTHLSVHP